MLKPIYFIVLTQFFQFNELKIKATRLLHFKLNQQYFLQCGIIMLKIQLYRFQI